MNYNPKALSSYSGIYGIDGIPVILIPTSFTSLDDFTLSCFDRVEESLGITLNPVITISGTTFALLAPPEATVKTNGVVADIAEPEATEKLLLLLLDNARELPENKPDGSVTDIVSPEAKSFVTFKDSVSVPPNALVHAAVPLNPGILGIHFFASAFHVVPTSQQPGP